VSTDVVPEDRALLGAAMDSSAFSRRREVLPQRGMAFACQLRSDLGVQQAIMAPVTLCGVPKFGSDPRNADLQAGRRIFGCGVRKCDFAANRRDRGRGPSLRTPTRF